MCKSTGCGMLIVEVMMYFALVICYYTAELKDVIGYHNVSKEKVREWRSEDLGRREGIMENDGSSVVPLICVCEITTWEYWRMQLFGDDREVDSYILTA